MRLCPSCSSTLGGVSVCPVCGADVGAPAEAPAALLAQPVGNHDTQLRQVSAPSQPPVPPAPPGMRTGVLVALVVTVILIVGGGASAGILLVGHRGDEGDGPRSPTDAQARDSSSAKTSAAKQLPTSFTGAPTGQWEVTPSDFLNGRNGLFQDVRPVGYTEFDGAEALYTPDDLVIGVSADDGDSGSSVIGLDPSTGQLRWKFDYRSGESSATCFSLASKHAVACLVDKQLTVIDERTGSVSKPDSSAADAILDGPGDSIYSVITHSTDSDVEGDGPALGSVTLQRGTPADPVRDWEQDYAVDDPDAGYDGGVTSAQSGDRLSLGLEVVHLLIDAADGRLLDQRATSNMTTGDPFGLAGATTQNVDPSPDDVSAGGARIRLDNDGGDPTTVTATSLEDNATVWRRELPDPYSEALASDMSDGFGRSSVGVAGDSVVFSSQIVLEGWTGFGTGTASDPGAGVQYRTPCGREPDVTATSATGTDGAIHVTLRFVAVCPGGQWVDGSAVNLRLSASNDVLGQGTFDFSGAPVWLPDPSTESGQAGVPVTVSLPPGNAFALPDEINDQVRTVVVACHHSAGSSGTDKGPSSNPVLAADYRPYSAETTVHDDSEDALAALKRIAGADESSVASGLDGDWVPQLSSKQDGTFDQIENHTYDYADILSEHLRLRLLYPNVRLLFSTQWKSYELGGFWVTVVGTPSPGPAKALQFCAGEGFPTSHCYAKHILRDGPYDGASKFLGRP